MQELPRHGERLPCQDYRLPPDLQRLPSLLYFLICFLFIFQWISAGYFCGGNRFFWRGNPLPRNLQRSLCAETRFLQGGELGNRVLCGFSGLKLEV